MDECYGSQDAVLRYWLRMGLHFDRCVAGQFEVQNVEYSEDEGIEALTVFLYNGSDYIQIRSPVYISHSAGRFAIKRFRKAQCPIIERLTNSLMMNGRNNGKKLMAVRIVAHSFEIVRPPLFHSLYNPCILRSALYDS